MHKYIRDNENIIYEDNREDTFIAKVWVINKSYVITIPKIMVEVLGLKPGDKLVVKIQKVIRK